jgi:hypothetical protein
MSDKPSKAPLFLGGCGCLCLLISLACFAALWRYRSNDDTGRAETTFRSIFKTDEEEAPKPEMAHYDNSPVGRMGVLAESYVGFGFDYPKAWTLKDQSADSPNFVAVERREDEKTLESLTVGYFQTSGSREGNEALYAQLIEQLGQQFATSFQNLEKISEGKTTAGPYEAYEGVFSGTVTVDGQEVKIYSRPILVATPDGKKGVTLLLLGTSFHPELESANDLGIKGELPQVVSSFRFSQ